MSLAGTEWKRGSRVWPSLMISLIHYVKLSWVCVVTIALIYHTTMMIDSRNPFPASCWHIWSKNVSIDPPNILSISLKLCFCSKMYNSNANFSDTKVYDQVRKLSQFFPKFYEIRAVFCCLSLSKCYGLLRNFHEALSRSLDSPSSLPKFYPLLSKCHRVPWYGTSHEAPSHCFLFSRDTTYIKVC